MSQGSAARARLASAGRSLQNAILRIGGFLLWPSGRPKNVKRLCIHRVGQIGDMVCALPAMKAVRQRFPDAEITLLTSPGARGNPGIAGLLEALPWLDRVEIYHAEDVATRDGVFSLGARLRAARFDSWVALPQDLTTLRTELRNMLFARWVGARWAGGFRVNTVRHFVRDQARMLEFRRESELLLEQVRRMGIAVWNDAQVFQMPLEAQEEIAHRIAATGLLDGRPLLGVAPGGKRSSNRWPVERFSEIARRWCERGGGVLVIGGPADAALGESIVAACGKEAACNLCGATSLLETLAAFDRCAAAMTNDSGPMHLAAAMGIPCAVAFSARDFPVKWYPWGSQHTVIRKVVPCSPCLSEQCDHDNLCLNQISIEEAWAALGKHLKTNRQPTSQ